MKKVYIAPVVHTEKVELGVFGCYGSSQPGGNGHHGGRNFWSWFFRWWYR